MKRTYKRIRRGFEKVIDAYLFNLMKGLRVIMKTGNNIHDAIETVISDALHDIDNRINRSQSDTFLDQDEEQGPSDDNILIDYCFGEINGPNFGIRTLIEYEEECEEGATCGEDINVEAEDDFEADGINYIGNRHI